jgi:hypothetical protein
MGRLPENTGHALTAVLARVMCRSGRRLRHADLAILDDVAQCQAESPFPPGRRPGRTREPSPGSRSATTGPSRFCTTHATSARSLRATPPALPARPGKLRADARTGVCGRAPADGGPLPTVAALARPRPPPCAWVADAAWSARPEHDSRSSRNRASAPAITVQNSLKSKLAS